MMDTAGLWTISRRAWLSGAAALALTATDRFAHAQAAGPAEPIQSLNEALLQVMKASPKASFQQRFAILAPVIDRSFDLTTVLRNSVGPRWDNFSPGEQASLLDTFRRYTVASYVSNFDSYSGQRFQIMPGPRQAGADTIVETQLIPADGSSPTKLAYVMRQTPSGWKAVDVLSDGSISRVAVQRSDFRSVLAGGGVPALMATLERKVSTLSGGALA